MGEALYAYVTCHSNIRYAIACLTRFNSFPAACHYEALRSLFKFLRGIINRGLIFWHRSPNSPFPAGTKTLSPLDENDSTFIGPIIDDILALCVDAQIAPHLQHPLAKISASCSFDTLCFLARALSLVVRMKADKLPSCGLWPGMAALEYGGHPVFTIPDNVVEDADAAC